jgi:hypothetical protein
MSAQHLKLIAVGLAVLLLLWGGSVLFSHGSDTVTGSLALPALTPADVDTITVVKGADSTVLAKQSSTAWTVNGHRAALDEVNGLLRALRDTIPPELVAEDTSSFGRLNVDSAGGRWLDIRGGGKPLARLIVGARGSEYASAYVRLPGDRRVYLWRGRLAQLLDHRLDDWRDKKIAVLDPDSIAAVDVERRHDRYTLRRAAKGWTLNGATADSAAVRRYLERLRTITATGFATPPQADSARAARPTRRLVVRRPGRAAAAYLSLTFDSTAAGVLVRHLAGGGGEGTTVYRMNPWDVDGLTPTSQSLLPAKKK